MTWGPMKSTGYPPRKLTAGTQKWRFGSDDFPFQTGDFLVPAVNFPGCTQVVADPNIFYFQPGSLEKWRSNLTSI